MAKLRPPLPARERRLRPFGAASIGTLLAIVLPLLQPVTASAVTVSASLVRTVALSSFSPPSPDPSGIAWDPSTGRFLTTDSEVEEMTIFAGANTFELEVSGQQTGAGDLTAFTSEPTGLALGSNGDVFVSDDEKRIVLRIDRGPDSDLGTSDDVIVSRMRTSLFGSNDPEDVAFDSSTGDLFVSDGLGLEIYRVSPGDDGAFTGVAPAGDDVVVSFDTAAFGSESSEGLGYDADRDTLLIVDPKTKRIFETTKTGILLNTISLADVSVRHPEDVVRAPSLGDPSRMNLYLVARGQDNNANPDENDGKMHEISVTLPATGNQAPVANAGPDTTMQLPNELTLQGSVSDDGLPQGSVLTALWSVVPDAPGTVTFADPTSPTTTASFSAPGDYVLRLTADDTALQNTDDVSVVVAPANASSLDVPIVASSDDAEEDAGGAVANGNKKLELAYRGGAQTVGLRFTSLAIPQGATIVEASVQFSAAASTSATVGLLIEGQAADDPEPFKRTAFNISSRSRTAADVAWTPSAWLSGDRGPAQRTPNLAPVIQEIVNRAGWNPGNDLVLIVTGTGSPAARVAWSYNATAPEPILHVLYA